jgi:hypothetical protein
MARRSPGVTREKLAITLPKPLAAAARDEVKARRAPSMSALIAQALAEKLERDRLQEVLDEMDAEYGPLTPEELAWADRLILGQ